MNPSALPIEKTFATGYHGTTLVLMICAGWLWAGLYASPHSRSPAEVAAWARLTAKAGRRTLNVGGHNFPVSNASLHTIRRWLDRNAVRVRVTPDTTARKAA